MADLVPNPSSDDSNSRSQNQQNIEGNENQVIGEVIDGTAIHTVSGNVIYNYYYRKEIPIENTTESAETALLPCPYRGLSHFEPGDAKYFFGRESFVEELVEATQTRNFIALLGASGSGKSSVVFAGLVPKLQQAGHWQFTHFRPGSDPFHTLALALIPLYTKNLDETEQIRQSRNLAGYFRTGEVLLADVFAQIQQNFPNDRVLLIADQFEELYTLCKDETTSDFLSILLAGIDKTPFAPVLVATMRADFLGNALSSKHFADVLKNADLKLGPMNREELTEAISKPAKMARHPLDLSTINLLIEQTADRAGTLPLLQFALTQIWEGLAAGTTPAETLRLIGGVGGALARKAQDIYDKLTSDKKKIAQRVFLSLVQLGEGDKTTCRQVKIKNLVSKQNSLDLLQETIYLFASPDARLITLANDGDAETAEITHEALFDNWQQLKNWLKGSREYLWTRQRLDDAIETWERRNRPEGSLWQAQDLESLRNFYKHAGIDMTQRQIYFFNASKQSAKWKKVKDISPYCMFGALITLCFFWVTDVEYITAKIQNENTFFVKKPTSGKDKYYYDLLRLVLREALPGKKIELKLRKANSSQGEATIALNTDAIDLKNRANKIKLDIDWMMGNDDRRSQAKNINFPLTFGLLSHRLCLVRNNDFEFRKISNKNLFLKK